MALTGQKPICLKSLPRFSPLNRIDSDAAGHTDVEITANATETL
jgi:hypothetical protein